MGPGRYPRAGCHRSANKNIQDIATSWRREDARQPAEDIVNERNLFAGSSVSHLFRLSVSKMNDF